MDPLTVTVETWARLVTLPLFPPGPLRGSFDALFARCLYPVRQLPFEVQTSGFNWASSKLAICPEASYIEVVSQSLRDFDQIGVPDLGRGQINEKHSL
jgi:hypothetical protein